MDGGSPDLTVQEGSHPSAGLHGESLVKPENGFFDRRTGWRESERSGERLPKAAHRLIASESIFWKGLGFLLDIAYTISNASNYKTIHCL